jgi:hypothetical protein
MSMTMTNTGHVAIAEAVMAQALWLAWGDLPAFLPAPSGLAATEADGGGALAQGASLGYVMTASNNNGETVASAEFDYTTTGANAAVTVTANPVSGATKYSLYGRTPSATMYLIGTNTTPSIVDTGATLGTTSPPTTNGTSATPWTTTPPAPNADSTQLYEELCRRLCILKKYVKPDANGPYTTASGSWSDSVAEDGVTPVPTRYIYMYVGFNLSDVSSATLYQYGIFLGTTPIAGYEQATYLLPNQISDPGTLLAIENIAPVIRTPTTRQVVEVVLTL